MLAFRLILSSLFPLIDLMITLHEQLENAERKRLKILPHGLRKAQEAQEYRTLGFLHLYLAFRCGFKTALVTSGRAERMISEKSWASDGRAGPPGGIRAPICGRGSREGPKHLRLFTPPGLRPRVGALARRQIPCTCANGTRLIFDARRDAGSLGAATQPSKGSRPDRNDRTIGPRSRSIRHGPT